MIVKLVTAPDVEPISVTDAKTHLRVDGSTEDSYISGLIAAARGYVEKIARRALITQTWRISADYWPADGVFTIPFAPLQSVTSIVYTDVDGTAETLSADYYSVDTDSEPGRIVLNDNYNWPTVELRNYNPIAITFVAGYGDDAADVPTHWVHAIRMLVAHWYENREAVVTSGAVPKDIPFAIDSLIQMDRIY